MNFLILAAGKGTRIGKPKLRLEINGKSFLQIILDTLSKFTTFPAAAGRLSTVLCVVSKNDYGWAVKKCSISNVKFTINEIPDSDMLSSIKLGLSLINSSLSNFDFRLSTALIPVDHPFVSSNTYSTLLTASKENPGKIIRPSFISKAGHPIIIPAAFAKEILSSNEEKLNVIIKKSSVETHDISVNDEYILRNINYPEDLK